jgi:hypothetical protein
MVDGSYEWYYNNTVIEMIQYEDTSHNKTVELILLFQKYASKFEQAPAMHPSDDWGLLLPGTSPANFSAVVAID